MSLLKVSALVLCTLTLSFAVPEIPEGTDMMMKTDHDSDMQQSINGSLDCVHYIYVMAFTSGLSHAGSDDGKLIRLVVNGQQSLKKLPNLKGDDYDSNKGDLWKLTMLQYFGFSGCIKPTSISAISIVNGGSDGWNIDSIVTYAVQDSRTYQQSSVDLNVFRWVDSDSTAAKEFPLTLTL